jgi:hypothetical protein
LSSSPLRLLADLLRLFLQLLDLLLGVLAGLGTIRLDLSFALASALTIQWCHGFRAEYSTYSALAVTGKLLLPSTLALLLLVQLLLLLLLNLLGTVLRICSIASALVLTLSLGVQLARIQRHGAGCWAEVVGADVRRVDSLPAVRAIDWEKAARWTKATGARRVAKARMADMASFVGGVYVEGVVVCGVSAV